MRRWHQYEANKAKDQRRADEKKPKPWWWLGQIDPIARYTKWLSIYTFALVVATIVSAVILFITDHTLKETLKAQIASSQGQLRAYVFVDSGQTTLSGTMMTAQIIVKNSGQTPAYDVRAASNLYFGDNTEPWKEVAGGIMGAGGTIVFHPNQLVSGIKDIDEKLRVSGYIRYRDAFQRHWHLTFELQTVSVENGVWTLGSGPNGYKETEEKD